MPRRPKCRRVQNLPRFCRFGPMEVEKPDEITLAVEELEAIRLKDMEGMEQEDCAAMMGVSRPTFHRILQNARSKIAEALVEGKIVHITGGDFAVQNREFECRECSHRWKEPFGTGKRGIDMNCPDCGSGNIHRTDQDGHGFGNQPWGRPGPHRGPRP